MSAFDAFLATVICTAAMWPIVVLIALFIFKSQITSLLPRLKKAGLGDLGMEWYPQDYDGGPEPPEAKDVEKEPEAEVEIGWNRPATLFWLGNDLMWTQDMIYRGAPAQRILEGLKNSLAYVRRLGPPGKAIEDQLEMNLTIIEAYVGMDPSQYYQPHFRDAAKQIGTAKWMVSAMAKRLEPDFEKLRAG